MEVTITIADSRDAESQSVIHTEEGFEFASETESVIVFENANDDTEVS